MIYKWKNEQGEEKEDMIVDTVAKDISGNVLVYRFGNPKAYKNNIS